jgi:hypothetical protein
VTSVTEVNGVKYINGREAMQLLEVSKFKFYYVGDPPPAKQLLSYKVGVHNYRLYKLDEVLQLKNRVVPVPNESK